MEKYKFQAKSEEGLLDKALNELGLKEEDVITKSYEEKGGLFSGKKYTLEVIKISDVAEVGKEIIKELLSSLGINANIETKLRDDQIKYQLHSQNNSVLIGKNGHILDSIQTYVRQALLNTLDLYVNITIDVEGYKEKQNYFIEKKVKKIARDVTLSKMDVKLDPMNSYERKVVHSALQGFKYVKTESEGEEPNRCVVIKYIENKED
ncbi:MAG: R3H domain-containing nucleic acid-binding protein [Bacilli bacterium]|nr:R3H domain-containing nucleic acid-binding protein [Bacilli bacterium]